LARESNQLVIAAVSAANADKAMAEQATFQEPAKFPYYEGRHAAVSCRSLCQKRLEVLLDDFVEQRILGRAALVFDGSDLRGTARATNCQMSTRASCIPGAG
jgi:hypothetical protein